MTKPGAPEPWLDKLMDAAYASSIPFAFGAENASSAAIRNGTCSAVHLRNAGTFLLTAAHIVTPALKAVQTVPNANMRRLFMDNGNAWSDRLRERVFRPCDDPAER